MLGEKLARRHLRHFVARDYRMAFSLRRSAANALRLEPASDAQERPSPEKEEEEEPVGWEAVRQRRGTQDPHQEAEKAQFGQQKVRPREAVHRQGDDRLCSW